MNQVNHKSRIIELYWMLLLDLLSIVISYGFAMFLRFGNMSIAGRGEMHMTICLSFMLFSTIYSLLLDWNRSFLKRGYFVEGIVILKYNVVMLTVVGCFLFLIQQAEFFSRLVFGYFFLINFSLTWLIHAFFKRVLKKYLQSEHSSVKVMLVSQKTKAQETVRALKDNLPVNYEITSIAITDRDQSELYYEGIPVVASKENLMEIAKQMPLDEVFIRANNMMPEEIRELINSFESMGIICHYSIDIADWNAKESTIGKFGKYTVISYSIYNMDFRRMMVKRAMDMLGGVVGIFIMILLLPFIAIAIKAESKGPIFFSQTRIGKNGRRFQIYKFRSMYTDAEERKKELEERNEIKGLMFKIKDDPRITKVGKFLRKSSLDELPQFYNILIGDMSLVGTRPPTENEFEQYSLYYRRRLCMTPGLTGLWQVSGRSDVEDFDDVVKYDLEYIDNWSLSLDLKILLQTIWVVFAGKGSK